MVCVVWYVVFRCEVFISVLWFDVMCLACVLLGVVSCVWYGCVMVRCLIRYGVLSCVLVWCV